jgi:glutathione S-transferase
MTITIHGSPLSPFVRKVRVVLAEKGVAYNIDPVSPFQPSPDFLAISPLKRIPVLRDDSEGPNATLADSSAICGYLERKYPTPSLYPAAPFSFGRALWFEEYGDSDIVAASGPGIFRAVVLNKMMRKEPNMELANDTWENRMPQYLDYYEKELGTNDYFVDNRFSIADIAIASPFVNIAHGGFAPDAARYPNVSRFLKNVLARPSFEACVSAERKMLEPLGIAYAL